MPRVVINDGMRSFTVMNPLMNPTTTPSSMATTADSQSDHPRSVVSRIIAYGAMA